jgi:xanthosine utilization system XapX-like protein
MLAPFLFCSRLTYKLGHIRPTALAGYAAILAQKSLLATKFSSPPILAHIIAGIIGIGATSFTFLKTHHAKSCLEGPTGDLLTLGGLSLIEDVFSSPQHNYVLWAAPIALLCSNKLPYTLAASAFVAIYCLLKIPIPPLIAAGGAVAFAMLAWLIGTALISDDELDWLQQMLAQNAFSFWGDSYNQSSVYPPAYFPPLQPNPLPSDPGVLAYPPAPQQPNDQEDPYQQLDYNYMIPPI